jgi:predicted nucleotidyltransferase
VVPIVALREERVNAASASPDGVAAFGLTRAFRRVTAEHTGCIIRTVNALVTSRRQELFALCRRYRVQRLELFGSATGEGYRADSSDLDFLVEFQPLRSGEYFDTYFGLREALEQLFAHPVDLVMVSAIRNPYFLEAANRTRQVLYAA